MNLLLATADVSQWVLFGILVLVIILAPIFMSMRNKKEMSKAQEVMDSLKQGDKILTTAGVIGTIISIEEKDGYKAVTIETGDENHKGYMTLDIQAIYMNLSEPVVSETEEKSIETEQQPVEEVQETEVVEQTETEQIDVSEEKQEKSKRNSSKKSKN